MLYCYHYDATRGKYGLAITRIVQAGGAITLLALVGGVALMLRRERSTVPARALNVSSGG